MKFWIVLALSLMFAVPVFAVMPDEMLKDPAEEARARVISKQLRCLVCQGEDIDESGADLAADLRLLVRERITAGDSNEEVLAFIQSRYGDYVLMNPPVKSTTALLWATPLLALGGGVAMVVFYHRQQRRKR